jgi:hypothetical protein
MSFLPDRSRQGQTGRKNKKSVLDFRRMVLGRFLRELMSVPGNRF